MLESARRDFTTEEHLFFTSAFSVPRRRMPALRRALQDLILEFVDDSETPDGDSIAKLVLGFYR
jgi:hypothetical protein